MIRGGGLWGGRGAGCSGRLRLRLLILLVGGGRWKGRGGGGGGEEGETYYYFLIVVFCFYSLGFSVQLYFCLLSSTDSTFIRP